jgi:drug/metabolite transporter (DMT)-like permease
MLAGIGLAVAATACFATLDTTTKFISATVPLMMALWVRYASQAIATTLVALPARGRALLHTANPKFQIVRGMLLMGSSMFAFFSLQHMPVGEFTAIVMIAPLVITVLAALVLRERVSVMRWLLVLTGFAGTLLIIRPSGAGSSGSRRSFVTWTTAQRLKMRQIPRMQPRVCCLASSTCSGSARALAHLLPAAASSSAASSVLVEPYMCSASALSRAGARRAAWPSISPSASVSSVMDAICEM